MFFLVWIASIVATFIIAGEKKLSVAGYGIMSIFLGPIALIVVLTVPANSSTSTSSSGKISLKGAFDEITRIKSGLIALQKKVNVLEESINSRLDDKSAEEDAAINQEMIKEDNVKPHQKSAVQEKPKESFEFVFGKYWLNRIGVIIFVLGVAFFISYTFTYLNAYAKIGLGYAVAIGFFIWGSKLEKQNKYRQLSWGILGGAWAVLYLSTYAMYYFDATRIIASAGVELALLAAVTIATIISNLKYRSWIVTSITFLLAFITAGLGGIDYSTVIYCTLLASGIAYIAYKLDWFKFLILGIVGTYITYAYWLVPAIFSAFLASRKYSIAVFQFQLIFSILTISWVVFSAVLFLMGIENKRKTAYIVAGILANAVFYIALGLNELYRVGSHLQVSGDVRFWFLIALSVIYTIFAYFYSRFNKSKLIVGCSSIALSLIATAILIKFPRLSIGFFWLLEMLLVFILGVYYKEIAYRIIACVLGFLIALRLFIVDYLSDKYYFIFGIGVKHNILIFSFAAVCFLCIGACIKNKQINKRLMPVETGLFGSFIPMGALLLTFLIGKEVKSKWLSLAWGFEGIGILLSGTYFKDRVFRISALCVLTLACLKLIFADMAGINTIYKIAAFVILGALLVGISLIYSKFISKDR